MHGRLLRYLRFERAEVRFERVFLGASFFRFLALPLETFRFDETFPRFSSDELFLNLLSVSAMLFLFEMPREYHTRCTTR